MKHAPVALFAYKRPEHTRRALEALSRCELAAESVLYIFCDGAKRPEDAAAVQQVRDVAAERQWCGTVEVIASEANKGLAQSITQGVSRLCEEYGRVIVLEDDLIVSPYFLRYMNEALDRYQNEEQVMQISGYMFDAGLALNTDAIFLSLPTSWGWGVWQRVWCKFDAGFSGYEELQKNRKLRNAFNLNGNADYFSMLKKTVSGQLDSWAIKWYLFVFMNNGLVLHPVRSLVINGGFDGSGTHCGDFGRTVDENFAAYSEFKFPEKVIESEYNHLVYKAIVGVDSVSVMKKIYTKIGKILLGDK